MPSLGDKDLAQWPLLDISHVKTIQCQSIEFGCVPEIDILQTRTEREPQIFHAPPCYNHGDICRGDGGACPDQ